MTIDEKKEEEIHVYNRCLGRYRGRKIKHDNHIYTNNPWSIEGLFVLLRCLLANFYSLPQRHTYIKGVTYALVLTPVNLASSTPYT